MGNYNTILKKKVGSLVADIDKMEWDSLLRSITKGDIKALARGISLIENNAEGYEDLMVALPSNSSCRIIGVTGPPGSGKSTLTDALIEKLVADNKKTGVLCIDPSSPFNLGAVLGDRIRMSEWHNEPLVYIRSLASRGALGGLNPKIIEITEIMKASGFDYIIIETVGVGQSEIEIAGLADMTVLVLVPEGGDDVQIMKAGIMEIADVFVVNKSDRPAADTFAKNLLQMIPFGEAGTHPIPIIKTIASQKEGIDELYNFLSGPYKQIKKLHSWLMAERAFYLVQQRKMEGIDKALMAKEINSLATEGKFNLYSYVQQYLANMKNIAPAK